jgi:SAM-dependent methyltransferase
MGILYSHLIILQSEWIGGDSINRYKKQLDVELNKYKDTVDIKDYNDILTRVQDIQRVLDSKDNDDYSVIRSREFMTELNRTAKIIIGSNLVPISSAVQNIIKDLTENNEKRILDIGSGVGKFCIAAASHVDSHFYGVEYRKSLVQVGKHIAKHYQLNNVTLQNANILDIDFSNYDGYYIFNPFYENLEKTKRLNDEVKLEAELYQVFLKYTDDQLDKAKVGTKLVTYHGNNFEVPNSYTKINDAFNGDLKLWLKQE